MGFCAFPAYQTLLCDVTYDEIVWVIPLVRESPLKEVSSVMEISDIQKIAVFDNVIMVYTTDNTTHRFGDYNFIFHWYVLMPDENLEIGFETGDEFLEYLRQNNLGEPEWREPLAILQEYDRTGCLDWIPDCK